MLERATAKDLATRYPSMAELVRDLEEVLTYESARSGGATGEATAILSQLPAEHRGPALAAGGRSAWRSLYVAIAAAVAVVAALLVNGEGQQNEPRRAGRPAARSR